MTATATTLSSPSTVQGHPALWSRIALMVGGAVLGVTATLVISDGDDAPARSATTVDAQFRDASAAEAGAYVEGLEARGSALPPPTCTPRPTRPSGGRLPSRPRATGSPTPTGSSSTTPLSPEPAP